MIISFVRANLEMIKFCFHTVSYTANVQLGGKRWWTFLLLVLETEILHFVEGMVNFGIKRDFLCFLLNFSLIDK